MDSILRARGVHCTVLLSFHNRARRSFVRAADNVKEDMRVTARFIVTVGALDLSGEVSKIKHPSLNARARAHVCSKNAYVLAHVG